MAEIGSNQFAPFEKLGAPIQRCVMPLIATAGGVMRAVGTGFVISPCGIMMTARHVLGEAQSFADKLLGERESPYGLGALYVTDEPVNGSDYFGGLIPIDRIYGDDSIDVALCALRSMVHKENGPLRFPVLRLTPSIPAVGSKVLAVGYYEMDLRGQGDLDAAVRTIEYAQNTAYTTGTVVEVFHPHRDRSLLKFPCFQCDAKWTFGMSGGPVMNEAGYVCGVVCVSLSDEEQARPYISYASLLWPAFAVKVLARETEQSPPREMTLLEMAQHGFVVVDEAISKIKLNEGPQGGLSVRLEA